MPAEKIPHLCGGILFGLFLEARQIRRKARNKLRGGTDSLTEVDVYAGLIEVVTGDDISTAGKTISKACTEYKTCQTDTGTYVPFTEQSTINAFDSLVRIKNPILPKRMSKFIDNYLNLDKCEWLVRALIETIKLDDDIEDSEEFLIDYDQITCAADLPYVSNVVLEPFFISVLHYVLLHSPDAESGRATFESWYGQTKKGAEWKLKSKIGKNISPIHVLSKTPNESEEASTEYALKEQIGTKNIVSHSDSMPNQAQYKDVDILSSSLDCAKIYEEDIKLYLEKISQKYGTVRTILEPYQRTPIRDIYVCNDIIYNKRVPERYKNVYTVERICSANAKAIATCSNFVIITGTGGIGKSMMMRNLLLDAIERYSKDGIVPIFLELKDYDVNSESFLEYLIQNIHNFIPRIDEGYIQSLLDAGRCLILLDGLDEVRTEQADGFEKELEKFIDRFPENQCIISSRPHRAYSDYSRFTILKLSPLTKDQAIALVEKLECNVDDISIKKEFQEKLESSLYDTHYQFAENPLLLTIMYMTYLLYRDVPTKLYLYYREAYNALSKDHDALKGLKRSYETGLTADEFAEWFSEFCARTYHDEETKFTADLFERYFNSLSLHTKQPDRHITANAFRDDLCDNLCLMYFESRKYRFTHRSFQEYFCALFFSKQKDRTMEAIGDFFEHLRSRSFGDMTFPMLYDMIPEKIDEYVFIPYLRKLFEECKAQKGYWTFLETMYPQIEFASGEIEHEVTVSPTSFIYEFIRTTFFNERYDFDLLPREDAFISKRYVYINEHDGSRSLIEEGEIPYEYEQEYGRPDEVGWLYVVDIGRVAQKRYKYKDLVAALEDDSFSLKKEFNTARDCYEKLLAKISPTGHNFFDQFS